MSKKNVVKVNSNSNLNLRRKLRVDFSSVENAFLYSYNYFIREYNDFSADHILEIYITPAGENIKAQVKFFDYVEDRVGITSITFNKKGKYLRSDCDCYYHSRTSPCAHVWVIARTLSYNEFSVPYVYKDENCSDIKKFKEELYLKERIRNGRARSEAFIDKMIEAEIESQKSISEIESVKIVPEFFKGEEYSDSFTIRYRIGEDKMYVVKDLREKLLVPIKFNQYVDYGKEFKTVLSNEIFDKDSEKELIFLRDNIQNIEKNIMIIDGLNIDEFYELHKDENGISGLEFKEDDFGFELNVKKVKDYYEINILDKMHLLTDIELEDVAIDKLDEDIINRSEYYIETRIKEIKYDILNRAYIITNKRFYLFEKQNRINKLSYMDTSKDEVLFYSLIKYNELYFTKDELSEILNMYKDKLIHISISDDILEQFSEEDVVKPKLYCDINENMELLLNLKYKNDKANLSFKKLIHKLIANGLLQLKTEYDLNSEENYDIDDTYTIFKDAEVIKFIETTLPSLSKDADVFLSDSIKNYSHSRTLNLSVGVKVKNNLLSLNFESDDIDPKEIYDILAKYRKKKKYYKMKSGEIIKLDNAQLEDIDNFVKDMGIDDKDLKKKTIKVPHYRKFVLGAEKSLNIDTDEKFDKLFEKKEVKINDKYEKILRDYQKDGVKFMMDLRNMKLCGLLADDMGLGKTLQVISLIESIDKREKPILIVTPSSLILNWDNEFKKFGSKLNVKTIHGNKSVRKDLIESVQQGQEDAVLITSYDYLKRDIHLYEEMDFDTVVIDEAQYIKNYKTKAARTVKSLKRDNSIALTGTPIENSLAEIWSVFDFLMPGYLFNYNKFSKNYEKPIVLKDDEKVSKRLKSMVEPFILRRLKKDVLTELPDKIEETYYIELNEEEKEIYRANIMDMKIKLAKNGGNNKIEILSMLTRLRQICIDAGLVYEKVYDDSSKIKAVMELVEKSILNGQKILIFSSFTTVLDRIAEKCNENGFEYFMLTGSTSKLKRKDYIDRFQNEERDLFLISLKAGGTGLNLTKASLVIHIDPWWNVSAQNQATDRAHRIGQKNTVQVINLIAKDTIEEKIQKMQEKKKELSDTFVENSDGSFSKLNKDELMELFTMS